MIFVKIAQDFIKQISLKTYLTDFDPQLMTCMPMATSAKGKI